MASNLARILGSTALSLLIASSAAAPCLAFPSPGDGDVRASLAGAAESTRFAVAVAAYGQKLRGDPWVNADFDWSAVADLAQGARGEEPYGLRAEFVQPTRAAKDLKGS